MPTDTGLQVFDTVVYIPTGHQGLVRALHGDLVEVAFYRDGALLVPWDKLRKVMRESGGRRADRRLPDSWRTPTKTNPH